MEPSEKDILEAADESANEGHMGQQVEIVVTEKRIQEGSSIAAMVEGEEREWGDLAHVSDYK